MCYHGLPIWYGQPRLKCALRGNAMKKVLITVLSMTFVLAASGKLVNFLTFNDPENLLRAAVGEEPSVVNYSKSNGISFPGGLGSCAKERQGFSHGRRKR